jgi:hypothetical protein
MAPTSNGAHRSKFRPGQISISIRNPEGGSHCNDDADNAFTVQHAHPAGCCFGCIATTRQSVVALGEEGRADRQLCLSRAISLAGTEFDNIDMLIYEYLSHGHLP